MAKSRKTVDYLEARLSIVDEATACRSIIESAQAAFRRHLKKVERSLPKPVDDGKCPCRPPKTPVMVRCLHCAEEYLSSEMKLEYRLRYQLSTIHIEAEDLSPDPIVPLWWCRDPDCDGGGFGFDLQPIASTPCEKAEA